MMTYFFFFLSFSPHFRLWRGPVRLCRRVIVRPDVVQVGSSGAAAPGVASVVRTGSQLARFNTARALFEKLGFSDDKSAPSAVPNLKEGSVCGSRSSGRSSRLNSESSRTSHLSSRSPSPPGPVASAPTSQPRPVTARSPSPSVDRIVQDKESLSSSTTNMSAPGQEANSAGPMLPPTRMPAESPPVVVATNGKPANGIKPSPPAAATTKEVEIRISGSNGKPELPAKPTPEKARISSKELIEKQKNWIQHFKAANSGTNKPPLQSKPSHNVIQETINKINEKKDVQLRTDNHKPLEANKTTISSDKDEWKKERSTLLSGWMASPNVHHLSGSQSEQKENASNFHLARKRFELQSSKSTELLFNKQQQSTLLLQQQHQYSRSVDSVESVATAKEATLLVRNSQADDDETRIQVDQVMPEVQKESEETAKVPESLEAAPACTVSFEEAEAVKNSVDLHSTDSGIVVSQVTEPAACTPVEPEVEALSESQVESLIEEALDEMDREKTDEKKPEPQHPLQPTTTSTTIEKISTVPSASQPEAVIGVSNSDVYYDNSVTSAQFDQWQLRTPTQLDDSPVFKNQLDFDSLDALDADGDESKQLEPDEEDLFRTDSEESDLSHIGSPPPEFREDYIPASPKGTSPSSARRKVHLKFNFFLFRFR